MINICFFFTVRVYTSTFREERKWLRRCSTLPLGRLSAKPGRAGASHGAFALAHLSRHCQGLVIPQSGSANLGVGLGESEGGEPFFQPAALLYVEIQRISAS